MPFKLEYDFGVKSLHRAAVTGLLAALLGVSAAAQTVHGVPPSVTSQGFGGHGNAPRGLPPSVTSQGFGQSPSHFGGTRYGGNRHHRSSGYGYGGAYYVPYAYPYVVDGPPDDYDYNDDSYNGGPTIFDRRGPGVPPPAERSYRDAPSSAQAEPPADSAPSLEPSTVLVFKDGHEFEVANYAIVGNTLYDLSEGRRGKISLSELDVNATVKLNDDRGIEFQVPSAPRAN